MMTSPNGTTSKKDLHIGGVGESATGTLAGMIDPLVDASENWVKKARDFVGTTDEYVRNNPWQTVGLMAMLGVTLGYLLSRSRR